MCALAGMLLDLLEFVLYPTKGITHVFFCSHVQDCMFSKCVPLKSRDMNTEVFVCGDLVLLVISGLGIRLGRLKRGLPLGLVFPLGLCSSSSLSSPSFLTPSAPWSGLRWSSLAFAFARGAPALSSSLCSFVLCSVATHYP